MTPIKVFFVRITQVISRYFLCWLLLVPVLFVTDAGSAWAKEKSFVAVIITGDLERYRLAHEAFLETVRQAGLEQKLEVYVQTPNPDTMSWTNSIRKAVGIGADVIVTYGAPATLVARKEARGTPVLFGDVYDPAALGILPESSKNLTGASGKTPMETLVKAFREIFPVQTIGVLFSSSDAGSVLQVRRLGEILSKGGVSLVPKDIAAAGEIDSALRVMSGSVDSLFVADSAVLHLGLGRIMAFAARENLPVISQIPSLCDLGALVSLEADPQEQGEVVAEMLGKILSGVSPAEMELHTPRRVSLVINLQVARRLNLKVPFQTLGMATRVIR